MHEMSVALEIARIAEAKLGDGCAQLVTVAVQVGDHAGVEPASLAFCLDAVFSTPPFRGARSEILRSADDALQLAYLEIDDGHSDD